MFELISSFIGKILGLLLPAGWKYAFKRWFRPSIETHRAPSNIFDHVAPGASKDHVKVILGAPHRVYQQEMWAYRFKDAMIEIVFWENGGAKSIALALTTHSPKSGFKIPMLDKPLGKMNLSDAMQDEGELRYNSSLRSEEIVWLTRIGAPGIWLNYTFGALWPLTPGYLADTSFTWNREEAKLISDPKDVLLNWIAVSDSYDEVGFSWSLGIPAIP
jgi:hypothetical protein